MATRETRYCNAHFRKIKLASRQKYSRHTAEPTLLPEHGGASLVQRVRAGGRVGILVSVSADRGGRVGDPSWVIAGRIRSALKRPPLSLVTIYDAAGRVVGTMDPLTRVRTGVVAR